MIEKVLGGIVAISWWYFLYHGFYTWKTSISPGLPGTAGYFRYSASQSFTTPKQTSSTSSAGGDSSRSNNGSNDALLPKFMGMPLYGLKNQAKESSNENNTN